MIRLNLKFLGTFEVFLDGKAITQFRSTNVKGLLLYLCLHPGKPIDRNLLATLFWPDATKAKSRENLRRTLSTLNIAVLQDPSKQFIYADKHSITFKPTSNYRCDVDGFLAALKSGNLKKAAEYYKGELTPNLRATTPEMELWIQMERDDLHNKAKIALQKLTIRNLSQRQFTPAEQSARHLLKLEPLFEPAHRYLMMALSEAGRRNGALRHFDSFKQTLSDELGIDPDVETRQLHENILRNEPLNLPQRIAGANVNLAKDRILEHLEILPDQKLFGVEEVFQRLIDEVGAYNRPWLISIDGMGGLGKTTLANEVVHHFLESDRFADIAWVSAKQEEYVAGRGIQSTRKPALDAELLLDHLLAQLADGPYATDSFWAKRSELKRILQEKPSLIVVDNLETIEDYEAILPLCRYLSQPSKFLITTRMGLKQEDGLFSQNLSELEKKDTFAFIKYEANLHRITAFENASIQTLDDIYHTIGGNPLALKLAMGQAHLVSINQILSNLREAKGNGIEDLYKYIYWQAWEMLNGSERKLFISLPLAPNGTFKQLERTTRLNSNSLEAGLAKLRELSLIDVNHALSEPRYRTHRLTETFLITEVIKWQQNGAAKREPEAEDFEQLIENGLTYWQADKKTAELSSTELDEEKEGIIRSIQFGLDHEQMWPMVKKSIEDVSDYMEQREYWSTWLNIIERSIALTTKLGELDDQLHFANLRGRILQITGKTAELRENYRRVIYFARNAGNEIEEARACSNLGHNFTLQGKYCRSKVLNQHALEIFDAHQYLHGQAHTNNHLGLLYISTKEYDRAEQYLKTACDYWRTMDQDSGLMIGLGNLGFLYNEMGNPAEAAVVLEKAENLSKTEGSKGYQFATIQMNLGVAHRLLSNFEQALTYSKKAQKIYTESGNKLSLYHVWENMGHIHFGMGKDAKALDYFKRALEGYKSQSQTVDKSELEGLIQRLTI